MRRIWSASFLDFLNFRLLVIALSALSGQALAIDLSVKGGIISSTLETSLAKEPFQISGFAPSISIHKDFTSNWTLGFITQALMNYQEQEISRTSFGGIFEYRIFGEARNLVENYKYASFQSIGAQNINLVLQTLYSKYNASIPDSTRTVSGEGLGILVGASYRFSLSERYALGLEGLASALNFSASKQKILSREVQASAFVQFSL